MSLLKKQKKNCLLLVLYGLIALSLFSPITSNRYLPAGQDYQNHVAGIVQASMAIKEGQFPIRVAPWQDQGKRNPFFQFYSPLPYTISGALYRLFHNNPFLIYKIVTWLALVMGAFYAFRLGRFLTHSYSIGILTGACYIMSPYLLINMNARGAFPETIAQGLIPFLLFYCLKNYNEPLRAKFLLLGTLGWFAILTTHLITFTYTSFFMGLLLLLLWIKEPKAWKPLISVGLAYAGGCILGMWYLVPIGLTEKYLFMGSSLGSPFHSNWLTGLPTLLSVAAVGPLPPPGHSVLIISIGWIILLSVGAVIYAEFDKKIPSKQRSLIFSLLGLFLLAFFMTWSPINIWKFLPKLLNIAQFPYRLLTQVMWIGTLLFAFALLFIFKKLDRRHVLVGLLLIGISSGSWLPTHTGNVIAMEYLKQIPDLGYGGSAYLVDQQRIPETIFAGNTELFFTHSDGWLKMNQDMKLPDQQARHIRSNPSAILKLTGVLTSEHSLSPMTLFLKINHQTVAKKYLPSSGEFTWDIPIGKIIQKKDSLKDGPFDIQFLADKTLTHASDTRTLAVQAKSIQITGLATEISAMPVSKVSQNCTQHKTQTICNITVSKDTQWVQLPIFYYPKLLSIQVNGKTTPYLPIADKNYVLAGVRLVPGQYKITASFKGIQWANWISGIAWITLLLMILRPCLIHTLHRVKRK